MTTAHVTPPQGAFDDQLPFATSYTPHLDDLAAPDALSFHGLWPLQQSFPRQHYSPQLQPPEQYAFAPLDHTLHAALRHTPHALAYAPSSLTTSNASPTAPSINSSTGASPLAHCTNATAPHPMAMSMAMHHHADADDHMAFDSTFAMPDFMAAGGPEAMSAFVGEYDSLSCRLSYASSCSSHPAPASPGDASSLEHGIHTPISAPLQADQPPTRAWGLAGHGNLQQLSPAQTNFFDFPKSLSPQAMPAPASYTSLFFGQSSGSYVAPLESSYPSLLQPSPGSNPQSAVSFSMQAPHASKRPAPFEEHNSGDSAHSASQHYKKSRSNSPFLQSTQSAWQPYPQAFDAPRVSPHSLGGPSGNVSTRSNSSDAEDNQKGRCPFADCGKVFKDLKAHMLTHQTERPEKCPIPSCEYNKKGFSRKYDKNRHTLTHYKGTMICGFCPGSGSAAEKSFNRADVFKRHLTTVHNVEQAAPNSKKKQAAAGRKDTLRAPGTTGKCSICNAIFQSPQDFYEHLEDCVLEVVQKVDPSEAINEAILTSMAEDEGTNETIKRHGIVESLGPRDADVGSDDDAEDHDDKQLAGDGTSTPSTNPLATGAGAPTINGVSPSVKAHGRGPGITYSASGIPFHKQPRKRRKNYPNSWGCSADKMKMKKRVLTVFDGCNRLVKDDMMISSEFEVRMKLNVPSRPGHAGAGRLFDSGAYVTDLDVESLRRAEGFFQATEEELGPPRRTNVPGSERDRGVELDTEGLAN